MQILFLKNIVCVSPSGFRVWWMYVYILDDSLLIYETTDVSSRQPTMIATQHKIDVLIPSIKKSTSY